jgi:hypothetical protein
MESAKVATQKTGFRDERGAALITVLMIAIPLLMAGGSLILITSMNTANTADMAAETKAYYAAESGAQQVLQVMRGNVAPNPLFAANPSGSIATANMIDFRKAVTQSSSNLSTDLLPPRLSQWLPYDSTYTDRIPLTSNYSPINGLAFNVLMSDPDNSQTVTFSTSGTFPAYGGTSHQYGSGANRATVNYFSQASSTINTNGSSSLGYFTVSSVNGSTSISGELFQITITQTLPWPKTYTVNCTLSGTFTSSSSFVTVTFPSLSNNLLGAVYTRSSNTLSTNSSNPLSVSVVAPQPNRLLARISGFGPRSAQKQMQMMLSRFAFDFTPVSAITLRSADSGAISNVNAGNSSVYTYSGFDNAAGGDLPALGVTSTPDYNALSGQNLSGTQVKGFPTGVQQVPVSDLPNWLQSADAARELVIGLRTVAQNNGRYFTPASPPGDFGSTTTPKITFVDGDADLNPVNGAGLLICTGNLTLEGSAIFDGLILVLGEGNLTRAGGGNGVTLGSILVARFGTSGDFLAPTMQSNGSGTSTIQYDSAWVRRGLASPGPRVVAIGEF